MAEETKKPAAKKTTSTAAKKPAAKKAAAPKKVEAPVEEVKAEVKEAPKAEKPAKAAKAKAEKPAKAAKAPKAAKEAKKADKKAETKVEKPAKVMPTEAKAIAKNVRLTPRKARLVIDLVRGKSVKEALGILANVNRAASAPVSKVIKSAAANATNNFGMDEDALYIASIYANDGLRMKRYIPRAKGSASGLVKRDCHITVVVKMR